MRILHIVETMNPAHGGPVEGILQQADILKAAGHTVEVVTLDGPEAFYLDKYQLTIHGVGHRPLNARSATSWIPWIRYGYTPNLLRWLRINVSNYDAVIVNGLWNYSSFAASTCLHNAGIPYFVFTHGMLDPYFKKANPTKHIGKAIVWRLSERRLLKSAAAVLFTTYEEQTLAATLFPGTKYTGEVVGYGIGEPPKTATNLRKVAAAAGASPTVRYLIYISRIHQKKGCDLLLKAFAQLMDDYPDLRLVMAGPGEPALLRRLQDLATVLGVKDRVDWPGMLTGEKKWSALANAYAFVLPSHQENFGIAVVEALASGQPVIISDKVNIWPAIKEFRAGFVASDTVQGTYSSLKALMRLNQNEHNAMKKAAQDCFDANFTVTKSSSTLLNIITRHVGLAPEQNRAQN